MKSKLLTFLLGFLFSIGLGISQMTRPQKILAFLDVLGNWDPSLLLVMAGAVGVYFPLQKYILRFPIPLYELKFSLPQKKNLDISLFAGAALFGIGWGMIGFCPGPSIVGLASGLPKVVLFVASMALGMFIFGWTKRTKRA